MYFPKTIWYTFEPNSKETDILSKKDKQFLLIRSVQDLKLIGNTVTIAQKPMTKVNIKTIVLLMVPLVSSRS